MNHEKVLDLLASCFLLQMDNFILNIQSYCKVPYVVQSLEFCGMNLSHHFIQKNFDMFVNGDNGSHKMEHEDMSSLKHRCLCMCSCTFRDVYSGVRHSIQLNWHDSHGALSQRDSILKYMFLQNNVVSKLIYILKQCHFLPFQSILVFALKPLRTVI